MAKSPRRRIVEFAIRALPDAIEDDARRILGLEVKRTARAAPKALPAPPKPLALPAPGPALPKFAVKPKGGQWWPSNAPGFSQAPLSPEEATNYATDHYFVGNLLPKEEMLQSWLQRTLPKYFKNEFGTPDDPLRDLAERGLLHTQMTPDEWSELAQMSVVTDQIGNYTVPGGVKGDLDRWQNTEAARAYPWMQKLPVTENIYGLTRHVQDLQLGHVLDEMNNAIGTANPTGLPRELMVRPESLNRMTFPQAVEHVGKINQFRVKEMERAALSALDSPAIQTFKEYAENNPMGLRWVELKAPDAAGGLPEGWKVSPEEDGFISPEGKFFYTYPGQGEYDSALQQALKYEGDKMGHCVGGYCPDVMEGRSRIFSLRDAKGEPHVTIETQRGLSPIQDLPYDQIPGDLQSAYQNYTVSPIRETSHITTGFPGWLRKNDPDLFERYSELLTPSENIIQIKGKQNRAPKDDYLPFVQDFVKSQQFGNVGDLANTGLVRLPDGRYLTHDQMDEIIRNEGLDDLYNSYDFAGHGFPRDPEYIDPEDWAQFQRHFEGYAIGGRVDADRCFCHNPLSVKKGR